VGPGDAIAGGLADMFPPDAALPERAARLIAGGPAAPVPAAPLAAERAAIDRLIAGNEAAAVTARLEAEDGAFGALARGAPARAPRPRAR